MKIYGSNITYSTVGSPQPITGICENWDYKLSEQLAEIMSEGEIAALVSHGIKGAISFSSTPPGNVTALGVRAGAELSISSINTGKVLVSTADAKWQRGQPMVMSAQATHFPDLTGDATGSITLATLDLSNPDTAIQLPTGKVWWSVDGLAPVVPGIVQSCSISESVQFQEEEGSEENIGKIVAVVVHGYKVNASMEVLTSGSLPDIGSSLEAFGTFRVKDASVKATKGSQRLIMVEGILVPGVTS